MKKNIWFAATVIGIANAVVLYLFELVGVEGTDWLWNDLLSTDEHRWRVLPVAWILGLALTAVILTLKNKRIVPPESDLLDDLNHSTGKLSEIGIVLAIGGVGLLAGASLGPEQSLMIASAGIGAYAASRWQLSSTKQLLIFASAGALLVAFIDSLFLGIVPLLLLFKTQKAQGKKPTPKQIAVIALASLVSYGVTKVIHNLTDSSGSNISVPPLNGFQMRDLFIAIFVGFAAGFLGLCLNWFIERFYAGAKWLDGRKLPAHDWILGLIFSTGIGILYLLGGQSVEFSGSVGSDLLVQNAAQYGALALGGLVIIKVLSTAWSKGTGYRGGLVFPSIYTGIALGLLASHLLSGVGETGAIVGGIAGMMAAAVGSPIMAAVFLIAVLPFELLPVAVCAIVGTALFSTLSKHLTSDPEEA